MAKRRSRMKIGLSSAAGRGSRLSRSRAMSTTHAVAPGAGRFLGRWQSARSWNDLIVKLLHAMRRRPRGQQMQSMWPLNIKACSISSRWLSLAEKEAFGTRRIAMPASCPRRRASRSPFSAGAEFVCGCAARADLILGAPWMRGVLDSHLRGNDAGGEGYPHDQASSCGGSSIQLVSFVPSPWLGLRGAQHPVWRPKRRGRGGEAAHLGFDQVCSHGVRPRGPDTCRKRRAVRRAAHKLRHPSARAHRIRRRRPLLRDRRRPRRSSVRRRS